MLVRPNSKNLALRSIVWLLPLLLIATMLPVGPLAALSDAAIAAPALQTIDIPPLQADWASVETGYLHGLAWGDADGDGDLDLAVGDECSAFFDIRNCSGLRVYRNNGSRLNAQAAWSVPSTETDELIGRSIAWGDMDGDGDLDLAVGGYVDTSNEPPQPVRVYRNLSSASELKFEQAWVSPDARYVNSLAWADMDGDGLLDLAVGAGRYFPAETPERSLIYRNTSTPSTATFVQGWEAPTDAITMKIAPADADGDGDLDLLAANLAAPSTIYQNNSNPGTISLSSAATLSVASSDAAWGDFTQDGKLDLVFATFGGIRGFANTSTAGTVSFGSADWSLPFYSRTSLDVGDVDNDGDLDIVGSTSCAQDALRCVSTVLLRNDSAVVAGALQVQFTSIWSSTLRDQTNQIAFGDVDGDGHLDLAAVNDFDQPARVFRNFYGGLSAESVYSSPATNSTSALAWGDLDADGDQDLAITKADNALQVLRNNGANGTITLDPVWTSAPSAQAVNVLAWGDADGDGDLDLASGSGDGVNIYRNDGTLLSGDAPVRVADSAQTGVLAWGDMNGDGALDFATDNGLFSNQSAAGGFNFVRTSWRPLAGNATRDVAWGDVDNDGDLDLAIANYFQPKRLYLNNAGVVSNTPVWSSLASDPTNAVRFADVDNDGDLDLAFANDGQAKHIYRNDGGTISTEPTWASADSERTTGISFADFDGDGDLDLAVSNIQAPSRIYRNDNGELTTNSVWSTKTTISRGSLSWADVDNDGDLDLTMSGGSSYPSPLEIFRNGSSGPQLRVNHPPSVSLSINTGDTPPSTLATAELYGAARVLSTQVITFSYTLQDREGDPVREVRAEFSLDGGGKWLKAEPTAAQTTPLAAPPSGASYVFAWDTFASGFFGQSDNVRFRLIAYPSLKPTAKGTPGSFQRAASATISPVFRARGTQVRVVKTDGSPAPGALVYRLAVNQVVGGKPFARNDGSLYATDAGGYLPGRGQLTVGERLVALQPIFRSSADERSGYTLYHTSAPTTTTGLNAFTVDKPGVQTLIVRPQYPLMLFHLKVSLEWDARADSAYLNQLRSDLQRTSELLYRWSDGQIALGNLTLYHDREQWSDADIRIFATNRLRPNANLGGIVTAPLTETLVVDGTTRTNSFAPGQIRMGTVWTRYGGSTAASAGGEDWARALGHELGHYALFLDESYLGLDSSGRLIPVEDCPSPMADVYRDDQGKFHPDAGWLPRCATTLANRTTGRSDWRTIKTFYDQAGLNFALNMPASYNVESGPNLLPLALTTLSEAAPASATPARPATLFSLEPTGGGIYHTKGRARAFRFSCAVAACDSPTDHIVDLGEPGNVDVLAYGARPGDRVCVFDLDVDALGCETVREGDTRLTVGELGTRGWQPNVLVTPVTSRTLNVSVSNLAPGLVLRARLYPLSGGAPSAPTTLPSAGSLYRGDISATEAVLSAYVHIWVEENTLPRRELVLNFGLGGNPTKNTSSNKDKNPTPAKKAPALSPDGQVILFGDALEFASGTFFSIQGLADLPVAPPRWTSAVSQGYRLLASAGAPDLRQATISMSYYSSDLIPGTEGGVAIYFLADNATSWLKLDTTLDAEHNEAIAVAQGPGSYALMTTLDLRTGWNLLSYPWPTTVGVEEGLELINGLGAATTLYGYEEADAADPWKVYDRDVPAWVNDLTKLRYGRGYWVLVEAAANQAAKPANNAADLSATLPVPPATYYAELGAVGAQGVPGVGASVTATIGETVCATTTTRQVGDQIVFVIDVPAATPGQLSGCGTPGRMVKVMVGKQTFWADWGNNRPLRIGNSPPAKIYLPLLYGKVLFIPPVAGSEPEPPTPTPPPEEEE